jgi:hypothetical protein
MREFDYYLEAWLFCERNNIPRENIFRKNWKTWIVEI